MITTKCQQCLKEFLTYLCKKKDNRGKFCSKECYNNYLRANPPMPMKGKHHSEKSILKMKQRKGTKGKDSPLYKGRYKIHGYIHLHLAELTKDELEMAK